MKGPIEEPVVTGVGSPTHETEVSHPAFAQIQASRVSGQAVLYDSDFQHQHFMTIRVHPSKLLRGLHRDWHHATRVPYIEVAMSESQWATFISTPNSGGGVPCTLQLNNGEYVPQLPPPEPRTKQFAGEVRAKLAGVTERLTKLCDVVDDQKMSQKAKQAIKDQLSAVLADLGTNLEFSAKSFDEHMEGTVEKAKQEVHAYVDATLHRAGMQALAGGQPVLSLGHEDADDE